MTLINKKITNGFYGISQVETFKSFVRFDIALETISEEFKRVIADIMLSDIYEDDEEIFVSIIVPYRGILDFSDAILHISEMSHELRPEFIEELNSAIEHKELIADRFGAKIELETVELINLLSAA